MKRENRAKCVEEKQIKGKRNWQRKRGQNEKRQKKNVSNGNDISLEE